MTGTIPNLTAPSFFPAGELAAPIELPDLTELVRGSEQGLLAKLTPLVRQQSITLDLSRVQRIDAAGIAALISLHANAYEAGYCFSVVNPTHHVAEILSLVGLERILLSRIADVKITIRLLLRAHCRLKARVLVHSHNLIVIPVSNHGKSRLIVVQGSNPTTNRL